MMEKSESEIIESLLKGNPSLVQCRQSIENTCELLWKSFSGGGTCLVCGNGGSAADAEHIVAELMNRYQLRRPIPQRHIDALRAVKHPAADSIADRLQRALPALSLVSQTALTTAIGNDIDADIIFAQQVYGYGKEGDVLIALSTSGNSPNVINAVIVARSLNMAVIGFSGKNGGELKSLCDVCICVPEDETYTIQERHIAVYHTLCAILEKRLIHSHTSSSGRGQRHSALP
jgi:D-sedoheptulose 7-phosphate isomerase